ncbi:hypothetical protein ACMFMG_004290 [Clarireedia jacksonii]
MFSKALIATLLASTAAATPITACASERTYQLRTFPTGAGSVFRGLAITEGAAGDLRVNTTSTAPDVPIVFSFDKGVVNIQGGQQLYIEDLVVRYASSADAEAKSTTNGWTFIAPGSSKDTTLGSLKFDGYDFHACTTDKVDIYSIVAIPTGQPATGKCFETIQLIGQEITA